MLLRDFIRVLHVALIEIEVLIVLLVFGIQAGIGTLVLVFPADDLDLHALKHLLEGFVSGLFGRDNAERDLEFSLARCVDLFHSLLLRCASLPGILGMLEFLLGGPGLLRCEQRRGVFALLRVTRVLGVKVAVSLDRPIGAVQDHALSGYIHAGTATAEHALCLRGGHDLLLLFLRDFDRAWVLGNLYPLYLESLRVHPSDVDQTFHVKEVLTDISLEVHFLSLCVYFGDLAEHIGSVLPPGHVLRVHHSYLPEEGIDVGLRLSKIEIHKLMAICEL